MAEKAPLASLRLFLFLFSPSFQVSMDFSLLFFPTIGALEWKGELSEESDVLPCEETELRKADRLQGAFS